MAAEKRRVLGKIYCDCEQRRRAQSFLAAAFLMAAKTLLSSSLFLFARICVPTCRARRAVSLRPESQTGPPHGNPTYPFLDELEGPLVLGDLEQLHGSSLVRGEATHLPDHVPHEFGVFGETLRETGASGPGLQGPADDGRPDPPQLLPPPQSHWYQGGASRPALCTACPGTLNTRPAHRLGTVELGPLNQETHTHTHSPFEATIPQHENQGIHFPSTFQPGSRHLPTRQTPAHVSKPAPKSLPPQLPNPRREGGSCYVASVGIRSKGEHTGG